MESNIWDDELEPEDRDRSDLESPLPRRAEIAALRQSLERVTSLAQAIPLLLKLGGVLVEDGQYQSAIEAYDKAIGIDPDCARAWNSRGIALGRLSQYEAEITAYNRALEIQPDDSETWSNRGMALYQVGKNKAAIESFDRALAIKPDDL